jgi:hypothetical protein
MMDGAAPITEGQATQATAPKAGLLGGDTGQQQTTPAAQTSSGDQQQARPDTGGNDWRSKFATGLDEDSQKVWGNVSSRYTSEADMAKAHVELVRTMDKRIPIPSPDAKPEELDAIYNKLGRPEKPDAYFEGFEFPQDAPWGEEERNHIKGLAPLFHKARATKDQVKEFVKQQAEIDKVARDAAIAKANTLNQQRDRQMRTEWQGEDYKRNRNMATTFVRQYAGSDVDDAASLRLDDGTFALDHPVFQRMFSKAAAERSEDDRDPTAFNTGLRESAKSQIEEIEAKAQSEGLSPSDPRWPHAKLEPLYKKAFGTRNEFGRYG